MPRLTVVDPEEAQGRAQDLLDRVDRALGVTPNMMRAMATFARAVICEKGFVSDDELRAVRAAGYGDGEIGEIVALNVFTNDFNSVGQTELDFPAVDLHVAQAA